MYEFEHMMLWIKITRDHFVISQFEAFKTVTIYFEYLPRHIPNRPTAMEIVFTHNTQRSVNKVTKCSLFYQELQYYLVSLGLTSRLKLNWLRVEIKCGKVFEKATNMLLNCFNECQFQCVVVWIIEVIFIYCLVSVSELLREYV